MACVARHTGRSPVENWCKAIVMVRCIELQYLAQPKGQGRCSLPLGRRTRPPTVCGVSTAHTHTRGLPSLLLAPPPASNPTRKDSGTMWVASVEVCCGLCGGPSWGGPRARQSCYSRSLLSHAGWAQDNCSSPGGARGPPERERERRPPLLEMDGRMDRQTDTRGMPTDDRSWL